MSNIIYTNAYSDLKWIYDGLWAYNCEKIPELVPAEFSYGPHLEGFLLENEKEKAGGLIFVADPRRSLIHLRYLWIHPAHRRKGAGFLLMERLKEELLKRSMEKIVLYTSSFQAPFFYPACHFRLTGKYPTITHEEFTDYHYEWVNMEKVFAEKNILLTLASSSPRRKALLAGWKIPFQCISAETEEIFLPGDGEATARYNAAAKAEKVFSLLQEKNLSGDRKHIVLGADTVIEADGRVLGKPADTADAENMLLSLAGKTHKVITAVALLSAHRKVIFAETAFVTFRLLSAENVRAYMDKVFVLDKAGAYAIQEHGEMLVEKYSGSMDNIVGLPVAEIAEELLGRW